MLSHTENDSVQTLLQRRTYWTLKRPTSSPFNELCVAEQWFALDGITAENAEANDRRAGRHVPLPGRRPHTRLRPGHLLYKDMAFQSSGVELSKRVLRTY